MEKIKEWLKSNWKSLVVGIVCGALSFGSIGYACGFVKGCSTERKKQEASK